jgi:hypothetical protein
VIGRFWLMSEEYNQTAILAWHSSTLSVSITTQVPDVDETVNQAIAAVQAQMAPGDTDDPRKKRGRLDAPYMRGSVYAWKRN